MYFFGYVDYKPLHVDDLPEFIPGKKVLIIGDNVEWAMVLRCPCGCKEIIQLNLLEDIKPKWQYKIGDNSWITISPSVNRIVGCGSHFFIRDGRVVWCEDN